jgi:uncharacterized protein
MLSQIKVSAKNNRTIPAIYCNNGANLTLFVHGITSEKTEGGFFTGLANKLIARGQSVLSIDLPGHGDSLISFTEMRITQMVEDLAIAYVFAKKKHQNINFVCSSFGASIFLLSAFARFLHPNKVVLLNPVTDYRANFVCADTEWGRDFSPQLTDLDFWEVERHKVPGRNLYLGRGFISDLALLSPQSVHLDSKYKSIVIHGEQDTVISIRSAFDFTKNRTPADTKFISVPNARHGFPGDEETIFGNILAFFNL